MKKYLLSLVSVFSFSQAGADILSDLKIPTSENYESGRFLCTDKYKALVAHQNGFYVSVPADYKNPSAGKTDIYTYFAKTFDPSKKTLFYFSGGPGQTSHWGVLKYDTDFNVLLMDQRGIACSRPATVEQYLSPDFYSSENVARDAEEIRKFLKIDQVSVYGISYGTMPATIYGSLFPQVTRSVILEGVVYSAEDKLWEAPHRRKLLQKMVDRLPPEVKAKIATVTEVHGITDVWLSNIGRDELLFPFGVRNFQEKLVALMDEKKFSEFLQMLGSYYEPMTVEPHILFTLNPIPYLMIACQEMALDRANLSIEDSFVKGKLIPKPETRSQQACAKLGAGTRKSYSAGQYPLTVPVTYFQGADDSATPAPQGIHHYKNVPRGPKQLLILREGGHNPNLHLTGLEYLEQQQMMNHAVNGEKIPASLIEKFNSSQDEYSWAYTSK